MRRFTLPDEGQYETSAIDRQPHIHLWGTEEWIVNNELYCGKILKLRPDAVSSLHYHDVKDETFVCLEGLVAVEYFPGFPYGRQTTTLLRGWARDALHLVPHTPHRFRALTSSATLVEFSTTHHDSDTIRIEPSHRIDEEAQELCIM